MKRSTRARKGGGRPLGSKNKKPPAADPDDCDREVMTMPRQVADYLHCHYFTVLKLAQQGKIPCFRLGGDLRFLKSEIDQWIDKQQEGPQPALGPKGKRGL